MKPYRNFSASEGEKSKDPLKGPKTLMADLDRICRMFIPEAHHLTESGEPLTDADGNFVMGGIAGEHIASDGLPVSSVSGLSASLDKKADKTETDAHKNNTSIHTSDGEKAKLASIESGAQVNRVNSVLGMVGDVSFDKSHIGLSNVDNTPDNLKTVNAAKVLSPGALINGVLFNGSENITIEDSSKVSLLEKGAAFGFPPLDKNAKIPLSYLYGITVKSNGKFYPEGLGDISALITENKASVVDAVNEIYCIINDIEYGLDAIIETQNSLIGGESQ